MGECAMTRRGGGGDVKFIKGFEVIRRGCGNGAGGDMFNEYPLGPVIEGYALVYANLVGIRSTFPARFSGPSIELMLLLRDQNFRWNDAVLKPVGEPWQNGTTDLVMVYDLTYAKKSSFYVDVTSKLEFFAGEETYTKMIEVTGKRY